MGIPVYIGNAVIRFPHLFEAHAPAGTTSAPKFGCEFMIDPHTPAGQDALVALEKAFQQVAKEKGKEQFIATMKRPWKDGTAENQRRLAMGKTEHPEANGRIILGARSTNQPKVVDQKVSPIIDQSAIFGGCLVNGYVDLYWSNHPQNPGIYCGLNGVQLVSNINVERLSGGAPPASNMFRAIEGAPAPLQPNPQNVGPTPAYGQPQNAGHDPAYGQPQSQPAPWES